MNAIKFRVWLSFIILVKIINSVSPTESEMTWADVFKDGSNVNKRRQRSELNTKKVYSSDDHYNSDIEQGQYTLQYLDRFAVGQFGTQNQDVEKLNHGLQFVTVKEYEKSSLSKDKETTQPFSFIYTEAEQPAHDLQPSIYVPQKLSVQPYKYATTFQHTTSDSIQYHHIDDVENNNENYASKYKFGYRINDPHSGAEFGHSEVSEGHIKKGYYHVLLPDGRLQNVKYWADPSGYHATVTYEDRAFHYPAYH